MNKSMVEEITKFFAKVIRHDADDGLSPDTIRILNSIFNGIAWSEELRRKSLILAVEIDEEMQRERDFA